MSDLSKSIKVEGKCIRCEEKDAVHLSGGNYGTGIGYGWCDGCMDIINQEDAAGLAAGY